MPPKSQKPGSDQPKLNVFNGRWACSIDVVDKDSISQKRTRDRSSSDVEGLAATWAPALGILKRQRQSYDKEQKSVMSEVVEACKGNYSLASSVLKRCGYSVDYQTLKRAHNRAPDGKQRGRPVDSAFEHAVLSKCNKKITRESRK